MWDCNSGECYKGELHGDRRAWDTEFGLGSQGKAFPSKWASTWELKGSRELTKGRTFQTERITCWKAFCNRELLKYEELRLEGRGEGWWGGTQNLTRFVKEFCSLGRGTPFCRFEFCKDHWLTPEAQVESHCGSHTEERIYFCICASIHYLNKFKANSFRLRHSVRVIQSKRKLIVFM